MVEQSRWARNASTVRNVAFSAVFAAVLAACGGGGGGSDGGGAVADNGNTAANGGSADGGGTDSGGVTPVKQAGTVSGKVSYDFVPTATSVDASGDMQAKLDYTKTQQRPVRHALVQIMSEDGKTVVGKTITDESGVYSVDVPADTRVYVRVTAQGSAGAEAAPDYLIKVRDNTAPEYRRSAASAPLYSMRGDAFTTATSGSQADLNAASGWTGGGYGEPRSAAPFAILDQLVTAAQKMRGAAPDVVLPALDVYWSVDNRPGAGSVANGFITSSHYDLNPATSGLYILGAENVDTDEYDASVIVHEFGHYLEDRLSRSDSLGGMHYSGAGLDMRVAFSEGFGNAFSSMIRETPVYTDTIGPLQGETGVTMNLEHLSENAYPVWFDEEAVGNMLYTLAKSPDVGFTAIYRAMLNGQRNTPAFTSVFSFASALRPGLSGAGQSVLDNSLTKLQVTGGTVLDEWGSATQLGDWSPLPFDQAVFPVYAPLTSGATVQSCTTTLFGVGNRIGNFGHLRVSVPASGMWRLTLASTQGGPAVADYAMNVYRAGVPVVPAFSSNGTYTYVLPAAGDYAVDLFPRANALGTATLSVAPQCVSVSLQAGV